jgi:hypothetical protein
LNKEGSIPERKWSTYNAYPGDRHRWGKLNLWYYIQMSNKRRILYRLLGSLILLPLIIVIYLDKDLGEQMQFLLILLNVIFMIALFLGVRTKPGMTKSEYPWGGYAKDIYTPTFLNKLEVPTDKQSKIMKIIVVLFSVFIGIVLLYLIYMSRHRFGF